MLNTLLNTFNLKKYNLKQIIDINNLNKYL